MSRGGEGGGAIGVMPFLVKNCITERAVWAGALLQLFPCANLRIRSSELNSKIFHSSHSSFRGRFPQQETKFHSLALLSTIGHHVFGEMEKVVSLQKFSRMNRCTHSDRTSHTSSGDAVQTDTWSNNEFPHSLSAPQPISRYFWVPPRISSLIRIGVRVTASPGFAPAVTWTKTAAPSAPQSGSFIGNRSYRVWAVDASGQVTWTKLHFTRSSF